MPFFFWLTKGNLEREIVGVKIASSIRFAASFHRGTLYPRWREWPHQARSPELHSASAAPAAMHLNGVCEHLCFISVHLLARGVLSKLRGNVGFWRVRLCYRANGMNYQKKIHQIEMRDAIYLFICFRGFI